MIRLGDICEKQRLSAAEMYSRCEYTAPVWFMVAKDFKDIIKRESCNVINSTHILAKEYAKDISQGKKKITP